MAGPAGGQRAVEHPIVFFDGVCHLCNRAVDFLLRADRRGVLRFASIQGETARAVLPPLAGQPEGWAMFYADETGVYQASDAALRICGRLGGAWALLRVLVLVPRPLRDALYRFVARNRYRWFGRRDTCRLPAAEERARFLP